jgi:hypothetical protein
MGAILDHMLAVRRQRRTKTVCHVIDARIIGNLLVTVDELKKRVAKLEDRQRCQSAEIGFQTEALDALAAFLCDEFAAVEEATLQ